MTKPAQSGFSYQTLYHPDGSSVRQALFGAGGPGTGSVGGAGGGSYPMNGGPAAKGLYETTPTPLLPPRPEPKLPAKGTPCYRCGAQAFVWRNGVPECAEGHAKKFKTPEKST